MKYYLVICLFILFSCSSENQKIEGNIVNEKGDAVTDVLVQVMGTDLYTYSDAKGYFAINTKHRGTELIFNKEGYKLGRESITEEEEMNIELIAIPVKLEVSKDSIIQGNGSEN